MLKTKFQTNITYISSTKELPPKSKNKDKTTAPSNNFTQPIALFNLHATTVEPKKNPNCPSLVAAN